MLIETGIYASEDREKINGWRVLCEQEKHPYRLTDRPDTPVLLCEGVCPAWLEDYLVQGGAAIITGAVPKMLPFETECVGLASLEYADLTQLDGGKARIQTTLSVFDGEGLGKLCLHENRLIKNGMHPDEFPAVLFHRVGKGCCFYSGIPFSSLIHTQGDTLRRIDDFSDMTERVCAVDKYLLLRAMREMLRRIYAQRGFPYVYLHYYPDHYDSMFALRVDVDGIYGDHLERLSQAATENGFRATFYVNQNLCEPEKEALLRLNEEHDIACHGVVHNLFSGQDENRKNVGDCIAWLRDMELPAADAYVAPRGMWNPALHHALESLGMAYTSDFGFCIYGLPFYSYFGAERSTVLQIPVDPFSVERATAQAAEEHRSAPDADFVADYFCRAAQEQYSQKMPVILYSHPQFFGPLAAQVLPCLRAWLSQKNIWEATMGEISDWWRLRDGSDFSVEIDETGVTRIKGKLPERVRAVVLEAGGKNSGNF